MAADHPGDIANRHALVADRVQPRSHRGLLHIGFEAMFESRDPATGELLGRPLQIGRGTLRQLRQNLGWGIGYNAIALPIAAGVFEPVIGLVLRPEIAALSMSGSSLLVATNALLLKRLKLPASISPEEAPAASPGNAGEPAGLP